MRKILRFLKGIWIINFVRRVYNAIKYNHYRFTNAIKWGFTSNEDTNFTYHLTPDNILYMANTIAVVTKTDYKEVLKYINEAQNDTYLAETILKTIAKSDERKFADKEVRFAKRLGWYAFVRIMKPRLVVETGVDKGLGSVLLSAALLKNKKEGFEGKYIGTDINPKAGYLLTDIYTEVGSIMYGDSIESLKKIKEPIDLFINDSDHSSDYEYQEYVTIKPILGENAILLGDNSHCTDKLAVFSNENGRKFLFFKEETLNHWYPGSGIGISYK